MKNISNYFKEDCSQGYHCLYDSKLSKDNINDLLKKSETSQTLISEGTGRGDISIKEIKNIDSQSSKVVIRKSRRGGLISEIISSYFLIPFFGKFPENSRPWKELKCLFTLREKGVRVPKPAFCGSRKEKIFLYKGMIGTYFIPDSKNMLTFIKENLESISQLKLHDMAYQAGTEAKKTLENGIFHIDLHIGNVMYTPYGIYLIDFDKYVNFKINNKNIDIYKSKLISRWNHSIFKRITPKKLQESLIKGFSDGLK